MSATEALDFFDRSQRQATWRFTLQDQEGSSIGELPVDRDSPPTVTVDTSRAAKRALQRVTLPPGEIDQIDLVRDRLSLEMIIDDGTVWPMGLYLFTASSYEILSAPLLQTHASHVAHLDLLDQTLIVDQPTDRSYTARPYQLLTAFLESVVVGLPITVDIDPSPAQVGPEPISWPAGTNRLQIINEVATMLGYHELYFDNNGTGRLGLMPDPLVTDPESTLNYSMTSRVIRPSATRNDDLLDLPNRFVVVGSGATDVPVVGRYDLPDAAPHSAANRGFVVTHSEQQQGVETDLHAFLAAVALSRKLRYAAETVEFTSPPDPRHDHYNTLELEGVRLLELAWSMTLLEGAPMRHTGRRTYDVGGGAL